MHISGIVVSNKIPKDLDRLEEVVQEAEFSLNKLFNCDSVCLIEDDEAIDEFVELLKEFGAEVYEEKDFIVFSIDSFAKERFLENEYKAIKAELENFLRNFTFEDFKKYIALKELVDSIQGKNYFPIIVFDTSEAYTFTEFVRDFEYFSPDAKMYIVGVVDIHI